MLRAQDGRNLEAHPLDIRFDVDRLTGPYHFGIGIPGVYGFAGYYSKDIVLEAAWADHTWFGEGAYWAGIAAAVLTAFYSWRLIIMTFHGKPRATEKVMSHVHTAADARCRF